MNTTSDDNEPQETHGLRVVSTTVVGPYLTVSEAAGLLKKSRETIRRHCRIFDRSKGRDGIKHLQRGEGPITIHVDDLRRWAAGLPPTSGTRRYRSAA